MNVGAMLITGLETGPDDDGFWNVENGGRISIDLFSKALAGWLVLQGRDIPISEAQAAFNTTNYVIQQAATWRSTLKASDGKLAFVRDRHLARAAIDVRELSLIVQVISAAQNAEVTVNDIAILLMVTPAQVREAVEAHAYMFLRGDIIEHEGE